MATSYATKCFLLWINIHLLLGKPTKFQFFDREQEIFAKKLKDYDITYPSLLLNERNNAAKSMIREKRSISNNLEESRYLKYKMKLFDKHFTLHLQRKSDLVSPGFIVETLNGEISPKVSRCEYQGKLVGQRNSLVAISNCDGLHGILKTEDGAEFIIEPVRGYHPSNETTYPHLIYNRQHAVNKEEKEKDRKVNEPECGVADSMSRLNEEKILKEKKKKRRRVRAISKERYVETLVVADQSMLKFYKGQNIEQYIFTVMNMVSALYHDASIGASIHIVLVRLILLEKDVPGLELTHNADTTLASFCKWSSKINPANDNHPQHHDVAVLLTRTDICRGINKPCGTLGLAQVDGMCTESRSCNINEDSGLSVAYTIAHELGHNFGMEHDGTRNYCKYPKSQDKYVMSPKQAIRNHPYLWSSCSRRYIDRFFHKGWGECLNDEPSKHEYKYRVVPPGVVYDFNQQCKMRHGVNSGVCRIRWVNDIDPCSRLWCKFQYHSTSTCVMRSKPAADGTACKKGHWCMRGKCVKVESPNDSVDGGWSKWEQWSQCSRKCGGGVQFKERHCNNPRPSSGGKYCLGIYRKYNLCNTKPCPKAEPDFRDQQCLKKANLAYFNYVSMPQRIKAVYLKSKPCELHCKREGSYHSVRVADEVIDGTPCREGTNDVCIGGKCVTVGCDWKLNSKAKEDKCGVCHGSGTSCQTIKSQFNKTFLSQGDYVETAFIPSGARNIRVEEVAGAKNYLALKSTKGKFYLNGDWQMQRTGKYEAAGTKVFYSRKNQKDFLRAVGPTQEDLHVLLFVQGPNPGISIEFTIPKNKSSSKQARYTWRYKKWSKCSSQCGVGFQSTDPQCLEKEGDSEVEDTYCQSLKKPNRLQRVCNTQDCPPEWWTGHWQKCNRHCGPGISLRSVMCIRRLKADEQLALHDDDCKLLKKPKTKKICFEKPCKARWIVGEWQKCSTACGLGVQKRDITCSSDEIHWCQLFPRPIHVRLCNGTNCPRWITSEWTNCSSSCGAGIRKRLVACIEGVSGKKIDERKCNSRKRPRGVVKCRRQPCLQWKVTPWSKCSKSCGNGTQVRNALCPGHQSQCKASDHPVTLRSCNVQPCAVWKTSPWGECNRNCIQWRTVICKKVGSLMDASNCLPQTKPSARRSCTGTGRCQRRNSVRRKRACHADQLSKDFCAVVRIAGFCTSTRYYSRCCNTCSR